jgi:hypothetical protein
MKPNDIFFMYFEGKKNFIENGGLDSEFNTPSKTEANVSYICTLTMEDII